MSTQSPINAIPGSENVDNSDTRIVRGSEEANHNDNGAENYSSNKTSSSLAIIFRRIFGLLNWVPPSCRYDPENPREFTLALNLLFGFAGTFTVFPEALYLSHPEMCKANEGLGRESVLLTPNPRCPRQRFQCHAGTGQYYTDMRPRWVCGWFVVYMPPRRSDQTSRHGIVAHAFYVDNDAGSVFDEEF